MAPLLLSFRVLVALVSSWWVFEETVSGTVSHKKRELGKVIETLQQGDVLRLSGVREAVRGRAPVTVTNETQGHEFTATPQLSPRQMEVILAGGVLNYVRSQVQ